MTTNVPTPKKQPRRELMETEIIAGAARAFDENGIGSSTLQDVADHLGIGRPSLYHYFPSKAALIKRLIDDLIARTEGALEEAVPKDAASSATERLRHVLTALLRPIVEFPTRFRILLAPEATPEQETSKRMATARRAFRDLVQSTIEDGVRAGEFRNVDPRVAAYMMLGAINWVAFWYRSDLGISTDELVDGLIELIIFGIAVPRREPVTMMDLHLRISDDLTRLRLMIHG